MDRHDEPEGMSAVRGDAVATDTDGVVMAASKWSLSQLAFPLGVLLVVLIAAVLRLLYLQQWPPGFLNAEAAQGLLAREAIGNGTALIRQAGERSPLLAACIALVGRVSGFDIMTVRLGAALAGIGAPLFTALWLRRALGPLWGVIGGLILAVSFWPLLFSRIGLSPAVGALALATLLFLWCEARVRPWPGARVWYPAAGMAAGLAFMADPPLRILPVLGLIMLGAAGWNYRRHADLSQLAGTGIAFAAGVLVAGPYVVSTLPQLGNLAFWQATLGLPAHSPATVMEALRGYGVTLARLLWYGQTDPQLNLPADPLLSPLLAPWALLGFAVALQTVRRPPVLTGIAAGALLLLPAALSDPGHPGRLIAVLPLLIALPLIGMRAVVDWARPVWLRWVVVALVAGVLLGNAGWASWHYFGDWARDTRTADAFGVGILASLDATEQLPPGEIALYSTAGNGDILEYLGGNPWKRLDFDGRHLLVLPYESNGFLVVPAQTPLASAFEDLFRETPMMLTHRELSPTGEEVYRIYRIDGRIRERLPLTVPTFPHRNGMVFSGYHLQPRPDGKLAVIVAWLAPPHAAPHQAQLKLRPVDNAGPTQTFDAPLPGNNRDQAVYLLRLFVVDPAVVDAQVDLSVALLDLSGQPVDAPGDDPDGFIFLNRYEFVITKGESRRS